MSGLGMQFGLQRFIQNFPNANPIAPIDYSGIIAYLNSLTDTLDTAYDGTNPILTDMEIALNVISGEIINIDYSGIISSFDLLTDSNDTVYDESNTSFTDIETQLNLINAEIITA